MRVQTLRKVTWDEAKDQVLAKYRGSATIERSIDPRDPNLPDFATNPDATMDEHYRFRVVSTKRFSL